MEEDSRRGKQASVDGFAHEHIAVGLLMKKYQNVSLVDLPHSTYDIIIVRQSATKNEDIIRAQVKTARSSVPFGGGSRGGKDRTYKSGVKEYKQDTLKSDVVIGVTPVNEKTFDLYFVPTILIEKLKQKSIATSKIQDLKNNWTILEKCKDHDFILKKCIEYGIYHPTKD